MLIFLISIGSKLQVQPFDTWIMNKNFQLSMLFGGEVAFLWYIKISIYYCSRLTIFIWSQKIEKIKLNESNEVRIEFYIEIWIETKRIDSNM